MSFCCLTTFAAVKIYQKLAATVICYFNFQGEESTHVFHPISYYFLMILNAASILSFQVKTEGGLNASASFVAKANPLNRAPHKRKSELHHALCNMLSSILASLAEGGKLNWPPIGVDPALTLWYDAVARIRGQLMHWMDKQSKHISVSSSFYLWQSRCNDTSAILMCSFVIPDQVLLLMPILQQSIR